MKIRYCLLYFLLLFIVDFGIVHTKVFSQEKDVVLVKGNPPLTQLMVGKVIVLLDWALELKLSSEQELKIKQVLISAWQKNNREEMSSTLDVIEIYEKVAQLSEAERNNARAKLAEAMLQNISTEPKDELSQILSSAYKAAHSSSTKDSTSGGKSNQNSNVSNSLVGEWNSFGLSSKDNYYNPGTGEWSGASGNGASYEFFPDGRYIFANIIQTSAYSCTTTTFTFLKGNYQMQGSTLTLTPKSGNGEQKNSCSSSTNPRKFVPLLEKRSLVFRFEREAKGESLCLTGQYGETCYPSSR